MVESDHRVIHAFDAACLFCIRAFANLKRRAVAPFILGNYRATARTNGGLLGDKQFSNRPPDSSQLDPL